MKVRLLVFLDDGGQRILRERTVVTSMTAEVEARYMFNMLLSKNIVEALPFPLDKLAVQICEN